MTIKSVQGHTYCFYVVTPTGSTLAPPFVAERRPLDGFDFLLERVICSDPMYARDTTPTPEAYNGTVRFSLSRGFGETFQKVPVDIDLLGGLCVMDRYLPAFAPGTLQQVTRPMVLPPERPILFDASESIVVRLESADLVAAGAIFLPVRVVLAGRMIPRSWSN